MKKIPWYFQVFQVIQVIFVIPWYFQVFQVFQSPSNHDNIDLRVFSLEAEIIFCDFLRCKISYRFKYRRKEVIKFFIFDLFWRFG